MEQSPQRLIFGLDWATRIVECEMLLPLPWGEFLLREVWFRC